MAWHRSSRVLSNSEQTVSHIAQTIEVDLTFLWVSALLFLCRSSKWEKAPVVLECESMSISSRGGKIECSWPILPRLIRPVYENSLFPSPFFFRPIHFAETEEQRLQRVQSQGSDTATMNFVTDDRMEVSCDLRYRNDMNSNIHSRSEIQLFIPN